MDEVPQKTIDSFRELQEFLQNTGSKFYYRGMASVDWRLMTSVDRLIKRIQKNNDNLLLSETNQNVFAEIAAQEYFINKYSDELNQLVGKSTADAFRIDEDTFLKLPVILQHYRYPTRIQDWTTDWKIALFFCLEDENEFGDIALWLLRKDKILDIKSCLKNDEYLYPIEMGKHNIISSFYLRLKPGIYKIEENFFKRIKAQKGIALTTGRADYMDFQQHVMNARGITSSDVIKININRILRSEIKDYLVSKGINEYVLFPKDIRDEYINNDKLGIEEFMHKLYPNGKIF